MTFSIFVVLMMLQTGEPQAMVSNESYATMAACEEALPRRASEVHSIGVKSGSWALMDAKCAETPKASGTSGRPEERSA